MIRILPVLFTVLLVLACANPFNPVAPSGSDEWYDGDDLRWGGGSTDTDTDAGASDRSRSRGKAKGAKGKGRKGKGGKVKGRKSKNRRGRARQPNVRKKPRGPEGIEYLGNRTWRINRGLVERWKQAPGRLGRATQTSKGLRMSQIGPGKASYYLGIRSGDVIAEMNGRRMTSKTKSYLAYKGVKNASRINLKVRRGGQIRILNYRIVKKN